MHYLLASRNVVKNSSAIMIAFPLCVPWLCFSESFRTSSLPLVFWNFTRIYPSVGLIKSNNFITHGHLIYSFNLKTHVLSSMKCSCIISVIMFREPFYFVFVFCIYYISNVKSLRLNFKFWPFFLIYFSTSFFIFLFYFWRNVSLTVCFF